MLAIVRSGERLSWSWLLSAVLQRHCEGVWRLAVSGACWCQARRLLQHGVSEGELVLPGAGGSHSDADPADADADERADFEQLQPDRAACGIGELGMCEPDPTQRAEQDI